MLKNEKIKASEVHVTGSDGQDLGVMPTAEALALARRLKVDLVCESLYKSPPPCRLIGAGDARKAADQEKRSQRAPKVKELRLTPQIEDHDLAVKAEQARRALSGGDSVQLVVQVKGKEGEAAKRLLEELVRELAPHGTPETRIQVSGKMAAVKLNSKRPTDK